MKTLPLAAMLLLALLAPSLAQVAVPIGAIKVGKVQPAMMKSPEFQLVGGVNKRSKNLDWLEVEVEFEVKVEEVDELTFTYTIMVENKLLDGTVTHINIPKGRDRYSVMYVAPRALEKLTGGRALTGASIQNVWVVVSRQGQVLEQQAFKPGPIPNLPHMAGMVLNKNETPFAPLFFDRYEAIKVSR